jgi:hypothetical protein
METKPYVVSGDIYLLLSNWAKEKKFILPEKKFFQELRQEFKNYFRQIFPRFEYISETEIVNHLRFATSRSNLLSISLDPVYYPDDFPLALTRGVDINLVDRGLRHRFASPSLLKQLSAIKMSGLKEICLVDDVIFSGVLAERVIKLLSQLGLEVVFVIAGVGINEGLKKISKSRSISCARVYNDVIDEVCERDFYLGIPYSGRSLVGVKNIGLPYFLPFGNPAKWALIPEQKQKEFSLFCLKQSIILFSEIEKTSQKIITNSDIERQVPGQPLSGSYLNFLENLRV